ncbi:MAG: hypothetical protein IT512_03925 [Rhodocyclaceae bacterium]|nr:hypothetical protein [Rhodocyclaceae bacterium]
MNPRNAKANLVRASIAFLVGETVRSGRGLLRSRIFMLIPEGGGAITRRELGANETVDVRDQATRQVQRLRAAEVSLYRHSLLFGGKTWRIMNIVG